MKFWNEADQRDHPAFVEAHSAGYSAGISTANATIRDLKADLSALKQRVAEVLEPFAEAASHLHPSQPDDGLTLDGLEVSAWRRAAELHASLTQEVKS